jgi:hypothetical protein
MGKYLDLFPKIPYDIAGQQYTNYQIVTNLFFRLRVIRSVINNVSSYYEYLVKDSDTPSILAEKVYNNPEAHWIILLANNMVDPQYDWPLNTTEFNNYITGKYGSVANAQVTYHHYEKVITREESLSGLITETRFDVNQVKLTDDALDVPYDYYEGTGSLPETQALSTYNLQDDRTVIEIVKRDRISYYDYESSLNDEKRNIKIIKKEYYPQIIDELNKLTGFPDVPYMRRFR